MANLASALAGLKKPSEGTGKPKKKIDMARPSAKKPDLKKVN